VKAPILVLYEAARVGGNRGKKKSVLFFGLQLLAVLGTIQLVSAFSGLPAQLVTPTLQPSTSAAILRRRNNPLTTTIMATPISLLDAFEASSDDPVHNSTTIDKNHNYNICTPTKSPPASLQKNAMDGQAKNKDIDGVLAHQSPIGKYLPRPMKMVAITTTSKRKGYLGWDEYFLGIAVLSSQRSKDPDDAEGACIADASNKIVAIGYSGLPRGCPDTIFPWKDFYQEEGEEEGDDKVGAENWLHSKRPYVCTAATNAVLNNGSQNLTGCRLYVTHYPTSDCVKVIIQSGIQELVILQKDETIPEHKQNPFSIDDNDLTSTASNVATEDEMAASIMLAISDISVRYYRPAVPTVVLDFETDLATPTVLPTTPTACTIVPTADEAEAARILKEETAYDALLLGVDNSGRRKKYLSWDDYFMSVALLTAHRSKDPSTIVGACIVDGQRRIVGLGYNGMPRGLSDDIMPWSKHNSNPLFNKYKYVTHAEVNAILNSNGSYGSKVSGGTLYVSLFPCENCTKMIIQSGIKKVVYLQDKYHNTDGCRASRAMMRCAKVEVQQYHPTVPQLDVNFYQQLGGGFNESNE